jgi:hypothetical protein
MTTSLRPSADGATLVAETSTAGRAASRNGYPLVPDVTLATRSPT